MRLSLRTLLAFEDKIFDPQQHRRLEQAIPQNEAASNALLRIRQSVCNPYLGVPGIVNRQEELDPNIVAEYLDHQMIGEHQEQFENFCFSNDKYLAEVASAHEIVSNVLGAPARTTRECRFRCYNLFPTSGFSAPEKDDIAEPAPEENIPFPRTYERPGRQQTPQKISQPTSQSEQNPRADFQSASAQLVQHPVAQHDHIETAHTTSAYSIHQNDKAYTVERSPREYGTKILIAVLLLALFGVLVFELAQRGNNQAQQNFNRTDQESTTDHATVAEKAAPSLVDVPKQSPVAGIPETPNGFDASGEISASPFALPTDQTYRTATRPVSPFEPIDPFMLPHESLATPASIEPLLSVAPSMATANSDATQNSVNSQADTPQPGTRTPEVFLRDSAVQQQGRPLRGDNPQLPKSNPLRDLTTGKFVQENNIELAAVTQDGIQDDLPRAAFDEQKSFTQKTADQAFKIEMPHHPVTTESATEPFAVYGPIPEAEKTEATRPEHDAPHDSGETSDWPSRNLPPTETPRTTYRMEYKSLQGHTELDNPSLYSQENSLPAANVDIPGTKKAPTPPLQNNVQNNISQIADPTVSSAARVDFGKMSRTSESGQDVLPASLITTPDSRSGVSQSDFVSQHHSIQTVSGRNKKESSFDFTPIRSQPVQVRQILGHLLESTEPMVLFSAKSANAPWSMETGSLELYAEQYLLTSSPFRADIDLGEDFRLEMIGDSKLCIMPPDEKGVPGIFLDYGRLIIRARFEKQGGSSRRVKSLRIRTEKTEGVVMLSGTRSLIFVDTFAELVAPSETSSDDGQTEKLLTRTSSILGLLPDPSESISWTPTGRGVPFVASQDTSFLLDENSGERGAIQHHPNWIRRMSIPPEGKEIAMHCRRVFKDNGDQCEAALHALILEPSLNVRSFGLRLWGDLGRFDVPLSVLSEVKTETTGKEEPIKYVLTEYFRDVMKRDEESIQRLADAIQAVRR